MSDFRFVVVRNDRIEDVVIREITERESRDKKSIGCAYGRSLSHCTYLANKYSKEFKDFVRWYRILDEVDEHLAKLRKFHPEGIKVEFYGDKFN